MSELADAKATIARMQPLVLCAQEVAMPLAEAARDLVAAYTAPVLISAAVVERIARLAQRLDIVADGYATACEESATADDMKDEYDFTDAERGKFYRPRPRIVMTPGAVRVELPLSAYGRSITIEVGEDPVGGAAPYNPEAQIAALESALDYERGRNAMMAKTMEHYPGSAEADRLELRALLRAEREKTKQLEAVVRDLEKAAP